MRHSLFHTSLKFYLLVLIVNRTFSDCTQSTQEFLLLISSKVKKRSFLQPIIRKKWPKTCQCLVAARTIQPVHTRYNRYSWYTQKHM